MIRNKIKQLVDKRGLTVYQFWKLTDISRTTAYALYNEPGQYPGKNVIDAICRVFNVQPGDVVEWVEEEVVND